MVPIRSLALPVSCVLLLALLPAAALAGPFLEEGGRPDGSGAVPGAGPREPEVALVTTIPGNVGHGPPLITDDGVYILSADLQWADDPRTDLVNGVFRLNVDTGELTQVIELPPIPQLELRQAGPGDNRILVMPPTWASDGDRVFISRNEVYDAYDLQSGEHLWAWEHPRFLFEEDGQKCVAPHVAHDRLYVSCVVFGRTPSTDLDLTGQDTQYKIYVARLDLDTGEADWVTSEDVGTTENLFGSGSPTACGDVATEVCGSPYEQINVALSVVGSVVVVMFTPTGQAPVHDVAAPGEAVQANRQLSAYDTETGDLLWVLSPARPRPDEDPAADDAADRSWPYLPAHVTGTANELYVKTDRVVAVNPRTLNEIWSAPIGEDDTRAVYSGSGFAYRDPTLIATSNEALYRLDVEQRQRDPAVLYRLPAPGEEVFGTGPVLWLDDTLYARSLEVTVDATGNLQRGNTDTINVIDAATGNLRWRHTIGHDGQPPFGFPGYWATGHGLLVWASMRGEVQVLGRTDASMTPVVDVSNPYPDPGATVTVDLTGTGPGVGGAATRFRADWGDGNTTDWQDSPRFEHAYASAGDREARFTVGNEAGQTSIVTATFYVGGTAPGPLQRFMDEAGPLGTLGAVLALALLLVGAVVIGRRRGQDGAAEPATRSVPKGRLEAYEDVVATEVREGVTGEDLYERLASIREALGVSDTEHARIEHAALAAAGDLTGAAMGLAPGRVFLDRYAVERRLGRGGAGRTFLCRDQRTDRRVVLKVHRRRDPAALEALLLEARAFASVHHRCVVTLHDVDQVGDQGFLVLEHAGGGDLAQRLRNGPLTPTELRRLGDHLLRGLAAVHEADLVHRDIKPSNVLIGEDGTYKLADFGIATPPDEADQTMAGLGAPTLPPGTPRYMAPEQAKGGRTSVRTDLYSAGLVLFEAITGHRYLDAPRGATVLDLQRLAGDPPAVRVRLPDDVDAELRAFFERALAVDARRRFGDAASMRNAWERALQGAEGP